MIDPKPTQTICALSVVILATALSACGGGGSNSTVATAPPPPVSTTTPVSVTVIDGAIQGAVVCLDKNGNGICDTGEPSGTTDISGHVTLTVDNGDVGQYPVVVMVGTDATIDADTGAVPVPFVMQAPADQTAVSQPPDDAGAAADGQLGRHVGGGRRHRPGADRCQRLALWRLHDQQIDQRRRELRG